MADSGLSEIDIAKLTPDIAKLDASGNSLTVLPPEVGNCTALEELLLFANQLKVLPKELSGEKLPKLRVLNLFNNKVMKLPVEIGTLSELEEVCLRPL